MPMTRVAIEHLAEIRRARENVVARKEWIGFKTVLHAQFGIGLGHHLHQSDRAFR